MADKKKDAPGKTRGVLVCISGSGRDEMFKLRRDTTIFGRERADIVIYDAEVSSTHCQIQNIDNVYHLFDMNSSNGTFLNDERIVKAKLKDGDIIGMGKSTFRFVLQDEKSVRHIPTLFKSGREKVERTNSIVTTLIEKELASKKTYMTLSVVYGSGRKETIELPQKQVFIGRASSFGRFDQDSQISRKHLKIKLNDTGEIFVEDQGSTNGSFINGKKISGMHKIKPTDEIRIGSCRFYITPKK